MYKYSVCVAPKFCIKNGLGFGELLGMGKVELEVCVLCFVYVSLPYFCFTALHLP